MSKYGPNVTKLIIRFVAREAAPPGGSLQGVIDFIKDQKRRKRVLLTAELQALGALALVKSAPDNPYGNDDEAIAGMLLEKISERQKEQRQHEHK